MVGDFSSWKALGASVVGNDHLRTGRPLQDASAAILMPRPAAVVCDGAGSAAHAEEGAQAAVQAFRQILETLEPLLNDALDSSRTPSDFADDLWHYTAGWICRALLAAKHEAARMGTGKVADYSFTFTAVVVGRLRTGVVQVGDGAVAVDQVGSEGCRLVFRPEKGRFCNMTRFLDTKVVETDAYHTRVLPTSGLKGVMVMSDGPEVVMVDLARAKPAPIVSQMIGDVAAGELDRLGLLHYLVGARWQTIPQGGDDKSVVILARAV